MLILAQTELHAFQITILLCLVLDYMACVIDRELPTKSFTMNHLLFAMVLLSST